MTLLIVKYATTAFIVVLVSEIAKRTDRIGALIGALPLTAILVMLWLQVETGDAKKLEDYARYTFWFVLPTLPMFLLMPWMMSKGVHFWVSLAAGIALTVVCFFASAWLARRFGLELF